VISIPIVETVVAAITLVMVTAGLAGLFGLMTVESFGIPPLPSEIILPFAGFLVAKGTYSFPLAFVVALAGGVLGSYIAYAVGRWGRRYLVSGPRWLRLEPRHLDSMDRFFRRHGEGTVLVARLVPLIRSYISYPAGAAKMEPVRFGVYTAIGAAPFTFVLMYAGYLLGKAWHNIVPYFQVLDYVAAAFIVGALLYIVLRWRGVLGSKRTTVAEVPADAPPEGGPSL
jgi:membrane protein DedA with SNARE-associated domain